MANGLCLFRSIVCPVTDIKRLFRRVTAYQMDQMTQQNAAMMEQSTAASQGLAQTAAEPDGLTGFFRIPSPLLCDGPYGGSAKEAHIAVSNI